MSDWKWQVAIEEAGVDLDDPVLNEKFVNQARQFLELTMNPESSREKLEELDDALVALFDRLHTVDIEEDVEKIEAIRENYDLKRQLRENQEQLTKMKSDLDEKERLLSEKDVELEETRKKVPVEPPTPPEPPQPTEAEIQAGLKQKAREKLLHTLSEAARLDKAIQKNELIILGVPEKLFEKFSFIFEGYTFDRPIFGQRWDISKVE